MAPNYPDSNPPFPSSLTLPQPNPHLPSPFTANMCATGRLKPTLARLTRSSRARFGARPPHPAIHVHVGVTRTPAVPLAYILPTCSACARRCHAPLWQKKTAMPRWTARGFLILSNGKVIARVESPMMSVLTIPTGSPSPLSPLKSCPLSGR